MTPLTPDSLTFEQAIANLTRLEAQFSGGTPNELRLIQFVRSLVAALRDCTEELSVERAARVQAERKLDTNLLRLGVQELEAKLAESVKDREWLARELAVLKEQLAKCE